LLGYHGCRNDNSEDSQLQHSSNQVAKLPVTRDSLPTLFAKELVQFQSLCASILIIGGMVVYPMHSWNTVSIKDSYSSHLLGCEGFDSIICNIET
jgi:hypothetical protein